MIAVDGFAVGDTCWFNDNGLRLHRVTHVYTRGSRAGRMTIARVNGWSRSVLVRPADVSRVHGGGRDDADCVTLSVRRSR